ncbi:MAG TPA: OmpH family outer membrane protein [Verrucomicrobiae bacterium]
MIPALAALVLLANTATAQTKIATVDVSKLFKGYYKTKYAQAELEKRKQEINKDISGMMDDLKTGNTDYQQLLDESDDQALSTDERSQKKQAADAKYKEIQDQKAALDQYERSANANLGEQFQRAHDRIITDIDEHVSAAAKASGYTIVLDVSAQSAANVPTVVYSASETDLTDQVLKQLNAGAPIDATAPSTPDSSLTSPPPLTGTGGQ